MQCLEVTFASDFGLQDGPPLNLAFHHQRSSEVSFYAFKNIQKNTMKENKEHLRNMAAETEFASIVVEQASRPSQAKKRLEAEIFASLTKHQDHKHTRRYSFDDNGGGYLGL